VSQKVSHLMFDNSFGKMWTDFQNSFARNFLCTYHKDFHITYNVFVYYAVFTVVLHYLVKFENQNVT